jgi:hypothetical protein
MKAHKIAPWVAVAVGALSFAIQPVMARSLLPLVGGSATAWTMSLAFFQVSLALGYALAGWVSQAPSRSRWLLVGLAPTPLALFVPELPAPWNVAASLSMSVGLPFVALACLGVCLQATTARSPYLLAAWSSVGSAAGLIASTAAGEFLGLTALRRAWWAVVVVVVVVGTELVRRGRPRPTPRPVSSRDKATWAGLAALASALLVAVSSKLAERTEVLPVLWPLPLLLFLAVFAAAFSGRARPGRVGYIGVGLALTLSPVLVDLETSRGSFNPVIFGIYLSAFGVLVHSTVSRLARSRPELGSLPTFWLWVAMGGGAGGLTTAVLPPLVLPGVWEFTLVGLIAAATIPRARYGAHWRYPAAGLAAVALIVVSASSPATTILGGAELAVSLIGAVAVVSAAGAWPASVALGAVGALFLASVPPVSFADAELVARGRSPYGSWVVEAVGQQRGFLHNGVAHGSQATVLPWQANPGAYYGKRTGVGSIFDVLGRDQDRRVAAIGVGIGSVVAYSEPGQLWDLYELDREVLDVARSHFTYITDSAAEINEIPGDGRSALSGAPDSFYDVVILDAYLGDSVPTHLLTKESFELMFAKLAPGGVVAVHTSTLNFELAPVVAATSATLGVGALVYRNNFHPPTEDQPESYPSEWVALSADPGALAELAARGWGPAAPGLVWTDDQSSLLRAWRRD